MEQALAIPSEDPQSRRMHVVLALFLIGVIVLVGMQWWVPIHGGVDENGYLVAGRNLAERGTTALVPGYGPDGEVPTFVGDMWVGVELGTAQERYYTKYPPGVPVLMAMALGLGGAGYGVELAYLLNPAGYAAGMVAVFLLGRALAGSVAGLGALLCVGLSGPIVRIFTVPGSHGISFGVMAWSLYVLVMWMREGGWTRAVLAGLLCGLGGMTRSGDMVMGLALVVAAGVQWREGGRSTRLQAAGMLGAWALPIAIVFVTQLVQTGHWSAYAATGEGSAFGVGHFIGHFGRMVYSTFWHGVMLALPLGVIGLLVMLRRAWRLGAVLSTWVGLNVVLYTSYYWAPTSEFNLYSRFFLPAFPALGAAAVVLFMWVGAGWPRLAAGLALGMGIVSGGLSIQHNLAFARFEVVGRNVLEQRLLWLDERMPENAVLLCDEIDMLNHLQFASDLTLYDFRLFDVATLTPLVENTRLNSLDPQRKAYLKTRFLERGESGMTALRDRMVAGHVNAGRRVFVFSGPRDAWASWDSLGEHGLRARLVDQFVSSEPTLPTMPDQWKLQEIVRR